MQSTTLEFITETEREAIGRRDLEDDVTKFDSLPVGDFKVESDPPKSFMPYMGTFHGICVRILHSEYAAAEIDPNFTIYDSDDQLTLMRRIVRSLN